MSDDRRDETEVFVDELDKVYDVVDDARETAETQRENAVLGLLLLVADYGRAVGLQREYPTPNQKLMEAVAGKEPENPDDPGSWPDWAGDHEKFQMLIDWTDPAKGDVPVDEGQDD
jgi:hypothetical protein